MNVHRLLLALVVFLLLGVAIAACGETGGPSPTPSPAPGASPAASPAAASPSATAGAQPTGQELLNERCTVCHSLDRVTSARKNEAEWNATVDTMIARGARLNNQEKAILVSYLAENYQ